MAEICVPNATVNWVTRQCKIHCFFVSDFFLYTTNLLYKKKAYLLSIHFKCKRANIFGMRVAHGWLLWLQNTI